MHSVTKMSSHLMLVAFTNLFPIYYVKQLHCKEENLLFFKAGSVTPDRDLPDK